MKGYEQFTLLAITFYSVYQMIKLGVYPDPKLPAREAYAHPNYLSNERREWDLEEYNFVIDIDDSTTMLSHTLSIWEYVIDAMDQKHFPRVEEAAEFLRATGGRGVVSNYRVPQAASKRRSLETSQRQNNTCVWYW